jgi:hypothetical protein
MGRERFSVVSDVPAPGGFLFGERAAPQNVIPELSAATVQLFDAM